MSVDALAAAAAADAQLAAAVDAELAQLAVDAQALRALLIQDMVVTARVLPSNGLSDLVEIAGRRVSAVLPPTVRPGDVLDVRVEGFDGDTILLKIVAASSPDAATQSTGPPLKLSPGNVAVPVAPDSVSAPRPVLPPVIAQDDVAPNIPVAVPRGQPGPEFTSAVSRANVGAPGAPAPAQPRPVASPPGNVPPTSVASFGSMRRPVVAPPAPTSIEARVAAARAAAPPPAPEPPTLEPPTSEPAAPAAATVPQRFVAPPQIESRHIAAPPTEPGSAPANSLASDAKAVASNVKAVASGAKAVAPNAIAPPAVAQHAVSRASQLSAYAEPVGLLRALRLSVTPSNVSAATLALQRPERLPDALAALERALPQASRDPNVATLRTLLAFVGRIDPRSPALATQIAAYVDHVVDGAEPKIATLLAASRAAAPDSGVPPLPAAVAAERGAALNADLKQTLMALAANPATPDSVAPSLAGALTALTAVQVTAAQTLAANPNGIAFTIPLTTPHGTSNAHISVKRDAPDARGARLDPENFRIAFVLETAHYGTVAIDLVTVGRDVTVDVRTEAAPAMRTFRDALGSLTARLESLRYRVAAAGASVGTTSTIAIEAPPARPSDPDAAVDRSA